MTLGDFIIVDLFAGAGGTFTGAMQAAEARGLTVSGLAVNHSAVAIATHQRNHPGIQHLCADIETINPRLAIPGGHVHLMMGSPECMNHSIAKGGKPKNEQSRASGWMVLRWMDALQVDRVLLENVKEWERWGPLDDRGFPIKKQEGETFRAFIRQMQALNYTVRYQVLNCANYGDPTTRERLFVLALRGKRQKVRFPEPTHKRPDAPDQIGLLPETRQSWRTAREVIDWSLKGQSIFGRKKPLSPNTLARIAKGLQRFSGVQVDDMAAFIVQLNGTKPHQIAATARSLDEPLPTVTGSPHLYLAEPGAFVIGQQSDAAARSVIEPLPTVAGAGAIALVEPFLVQYHGASSPNGHRVRSLDDPAPAVTTENNAYLVQPFIVQMDEGGSLHTVDKPLSTVTSANARALVNPFVLDVRGTDGYARGGGVDEPLGAVTAITTRALIEPFVVETRHGDDPDRSYSLDRPVPTVTGLNGLGVVETEGFTVNYNGTGIAHSMDAPLPTVTGAERLGLVVVLKDGRQAVVDIRFRMLQPHELAAAQGFPDTYVFEGTSVRAVTKQIGNAVPVNTAAALAGALMDA